jgi:hypothetical protein
LEEQEEKTILVLGEEKQSVDNTAHVFQDGFTIVLEDECDRYRIITSIKNFTYRVEIFMDDALEDAVEVVCDAEGETLFKVKYTKAHQGYKEKFCQKVNHLDSEDEDISFSESTYDFEEENNKHEYLHVIGKKVEETYQKVKANIRARGYNHRVVLVTVLFTVVLLFVGLGRVLMCNENIITFFVKQVDRISYYEQTESFCHKLEKGCLKLSKMNLEQDTLLSPDECRTWCEDKVIPEKKCALFLPYFPKKEEEIPLVVKVKEEPKKVASKVMIKERYTFTPKEKIVLYPKKYLELFITNNTEDVLKVVLKKIVLNENEYEEIVQFRLGVTTLSVEAGSKKRFEIFLEQTYYEQFEKGEYTGKLLFSVFLHKSRVENVEKIFSFRVE